MPSKHSNPTMRHSDGVSIREYVDLKIAAICESMAKSDGYLEGRLKNMNEFRAALESQANTFVTRKELTLTIDPLSKDLREVRDFMAKQQGKASQSALLFTTVIAIIGVIIGAIGIFVK